MTAPSTDTPVLVINAGSSSLKVKLLPGSAAMLIERIGADPVASDAAGPLTVPPLEGHGDALDFALDRMAARGAGEPVAVGHRVVHGGERYSAPVLIDDEVERSIVLLSRLAPLHNPGNLAAIRAARQRLPGLPHVAVFDTAFHATLPQRAYLYGLPLAFAREHGIRRYGFHGTSHDLVTRRAAESLGRARKELRIVSFHLGNGASAAAVAFGRSVDTSMGFTPLEGLLMGSRCGDLDPGVLLHLLRQGMTVAELDELLNRDSGLRGMSGTSNDMRDVRAAALAGAEGAAAAIELFGYRVRKTVGAYAAAMGGLDAVVFTGGIGENDSKVRREALAGLEFLGIELDAERNRANAELISSSASRVAVLVVPADEESLIAEEVRQVVGGRA